MNPLRTFLLLVGVLFVGGCATNRLPSLLPEKPGIPDVSHTTKPIEKAQDRASDELHRLDLRIAALDGEKAQLLQEKKAEVDRADRAETQAIDRTIFILTLALIVGVAASTVLAVWWQSKSFALLALAAGSAIPIVRATKLAINHPIITGTVIIGGVLVTLVIMLAKSSKIHAALSDAVSFGKNAMGHLERLEPSAAELVKVIEKEKQDVNKTRDVINKALQGVA